MSDTTWGALIGLATAFTTGVLVKLVDVWSGGRGKRMDELSSHRERLERRVETLEARLEEKDKEFDEYRERTQREILELKLRLARCEREHGE